jgi:type IV pilus assembly protein PilW
MTSQAVKFHSQPSREPAAGFSLIELMVAVTLGLLLILAMATLLAQQNRARSELEKSSAQVENGRYALGILQSDIQLAGFYGEFAGSIAAPGTLPNACETANMTNINASLALPLQGYNDVGSTIPSTLSGCLSAANHVEGTDVLVVRRLQAADPASLSTIASAAASNPKRVYVQANPDGRVTDLGENSASFTLFKKDGVTPADLRAYVERIYFVSPCNVFASGQSSCTANADGGTPIPTLKRLELSVASGVAAFVLTPLVEGVENMQIDYGVDTEGAGGPASPFIEAPTLAQWPSVVAVNISLLVRNPTETVGHADSKSYNLGVMGAVGPFGDGFKRHVYSSGVRVINVSGRKE